MEDRWLTIGDAAELLAVNPKTVRRRIADGTLTASRIGPRLVRVRARDVEALLRPIPTAGRVA
jgi:excisionase family DNA binding protein